MDHRIASDGNQAYRPVNGGAKNAWDGPEAAPEVFGAGAPTSNAIVTHSACQKLRSRPEVPAQLVGEAPAFKDIVSRLPALARADGSLLITGETGTGKELVARALHELGPRASLPFVAVNCGSLADTLLESELFGHERGAFTDAHARRQGLIARAAGGTLFLDEVETLSPRGQVAPCEWSRTDFRPSAPRHNGWMFVAARRQAGSSGQAGSFRTRVHRLCVFDHAATPRATGRHPAAVSVLSRETRRQVRPGAKLSLCGGDARVRLAGERARRARSRGAGQGHRGG
jgi:hypothetical protein